MLITTCVTGSVAAVALRRVADLARAAPETTSSRGLWRGSTGSGDRNNPPSTTSREPTRDSTGYRVVNI